MIPTEWLDELRARTSLSALIGRSVKLRRAGNEWTACCPFHKEKTPSFTVSDEKGFYHCFGCGAHGDAIRWLSDAKGMEFFDAVRELADAAGMQVPARDRPAEPIDDGALMICAHAAAWFREQLMGLDGGNARAYLAKRGITEASIDAFGIGFAPDSRNRLRSALSDFGDEALVAAGVLTDPGDGRDPYDRFRSRIVFPIRDVKGRVVAFGGRILGPGEPKYLNSPETTLFDKGRSLFNLDRAVSPGRIAGRMVVVEGYMDVVALDQAGIAETVAVNGTALTEAQIALLWRSNPKPLVCFDGDAAGRRAAVKAATRALPGITAERSLGFVAMPAGLDPDDVVRAGGKEAVEQLLAVARPLVDVLWDHERDAGPLTTPEARTALRERLSAHVANIADPTLRREYEREFKRRADDLFFAQRRPLKGKHHRKFTPRTTPPPDPGKVRGKMVAAVLRGLARHPEVLTDNAELAMALPVDSDAHKRALDLLLDGLFNPPLPEPATIDELFPGERSWHGLHPTFLSPTAWPRRAEADLVHYMTCLVAVSEGASPEQLAKMVREYEPPEPPATGKLL